MGGAPAQLVILVAQIGTVIPEARHGRRDLFLSDEQGVPASDEQGVPADRLRAVSFGEEHAKYDNSHEPTRRLNRRVALVIDAQP
jgi:hypothetical protein